MKTLKYKTNINCQGCIKAVSYYLNNDATIENWQVDTTNHNRILTVEGEQIDQEKVVEIVKRAGFEIEIIS